jgi:hypothetical protein
MTGSTVNKKREKDDQNVAIEKYDEQQQLF